MTVHIGKKYLENLSRIKQCIFSLIDRDFQENPQVMLTDSRGACYYDKCYRNQIGRKTKISYPAEIQVRISYDNGKIEQYFFHEECIEKLLSDNRRIPNPN